MTWTWDGEAVRVGVDRAGTGPALLLLPALSSISTRREMRPLQERLASSFAPVAVDWPGFGDRPRPRVDWRPTRRSWPTSAAASPATSAARWPPGTRPATRSSGPRPGPGRWADSAWSP
jgi:hypothetical protein